jgi:hypothetical protein
MRAARSLLLASAVAASAAPVSAAPRLPGPPRPGHVYAGGRPGRAELDATRARERQDGVQALSARGQYRPGRQLLADLRHMTSDPRDPTEPGEASGYARMSRWAARRLQSRGVLPAGDGRSGLARYFQAFEWDQRYAPGRARSRNVVGIRHGDGSTSEAILVVAHLDGLSAAQKRSYQRADGRPLDGYQAANDNASAVASLLYVSDVLDRLERQRGAPLKRDVVFLISSGEEEGLKGAEAFARFSHQFGDKRFIGVVNFEMVGQGDRNAVAVLGGEREPVARRNPLYRRALGLRVRGNVARVLPGLRRADRAEGWFRRSDHFPFARAGLDTILYVGQPGAYHHLEDDFDHLDPDTNLAVARHAVRLIVDTAENGTGKRGRTLPVRRGRFGRRLNPLGRTVYPADIADEE